MVPNIFGIRQSNYLGQKFYLPVKQKNGCVMFCIFLQNNAVWQAITFDTIVELIIFINL